MSKQRILENKNISRSCPTSRSSHERISVLKKKCSNIIENEANTDGRVTH